MRKILATTIVVLAPTTAMAADGNIYDGFGSVAVGYNVLDEGKWWEDYGYFEGSDYSDSGNGEDKADGLDLEVRASAAAPLSGNFAGQVDGVFTRTALKWDDCDGCPTWKLNETSIAAHAFWREPDKGLVGLVGQRTAHTSNSWSGITTYYIGGEGQAHLDRFTIYGQVSYASVDHSYVDTDGVNAALQLRYFPQDNLMVALKGGYERMTTKPDDDYYDCPDYCYKDKATTWLIGAKAEYRLPDSKFSLFADADYRDIKFRNSYIDSDYYWREEQYKYSDFRAMVGVKINFGSSTLLERDRSGASLDPVRPLAPNMWSFEM